MKENKLKKRRVARRSRRIGAKMSKKLVGLFGVVILALVLLAGVNTYYATYTGKNYSRIVLSQAQQKLESRIIPYRRGDITDRNGTILATSEKVYNLILDCEVVNYEQKGTDGITVKPYYDVTVDAVHKFFDIDTDEIKDVLNSEDTRHRRYYILKKGVTITEKKEFEAYTDLSTEENKTLPEDQKQMRRNISGVWFEDDYERKYPMGSLACDTIGFTYTANEADWGIEGYYSDVLNGVDGRQYGHYDANQEDESHAQQEIVDAQDGLNVVSTLDVNIQQIIRQSIKDFNAVMAEEQGIEVREDEEAPNGAENIAVIVMDPNTGEILGMDSTDWYDLNDPRNLEPFYSESSIEAMDDDAKIEVWNNLWQNYCISANFEPGSTVKPITAATALQTGKVNGSARFKCDGGEQVAEYYIGCVLEHGEETMADGIQNSCNDLFMQVANQVGAENIIEYQELFNFGKQTGIDLPGESEGVVFGEATMGEVELATTSFGQGFTCTMIQEAAAISAIINGGDYYTPHVVSAITDQNGTVVKKYDNMLEKKVVSKETSNYLREAMGQVVTMNGTAYSAKLDGYTMGGKTGTAEKHPREEGNYLVSFVGFAPLDNPQVLIYVIVDEPHNEKQDTSAYAVYIEKKIMREILPYMNIFQDEPLTGKEREPSWKMTLEEESYDEDVYEEETYGDSYEESQE